jgi:hypothetical protein
MPEVPPGATGLRPSGRTTSFLGLADAPSGDPAGHDPKERFPVAAWPRLDPGLEHRCAFSLAIHMVRGPAFTQSAGAAGLAGRGKVTEVPSYGVELPCRVMAGRRNH